jgi:transcriptional antiterminator NusG
VNQADPVAADEEDLMAEREPDEQAENALPAEGEQPRVETPAEDAARPATPTSDAPETPDSAAETEATVEGTASSEPAATSEAPVAEEAEAEPAEGPAAEEPKAESPEAPATVEPPAEEAVPAESSESMPSAAQAPASTASEEPESAESVTSEPEAVEAGGGEQAASESAEAPAVPAAEGGAVSAETPSGAAWYVIHCYSGYENKVRHNLEQRIETMGMKDKIFDVVIPTQEEIEVKEGKRRTVERHIFPGYVLVNMALTEESWYVVRNTPGVTGFVGMGNLPTALRPEEVAQIVKRMEAEAPTVKVSFKVGERVRIIDGPFNDFRGTVSDIDMERTKVRVMVSFFGRETPVELDFLQVEKS